MSKQERIPGQFSGTTYSFTVVREAPEGYEYYAPYVIALVDVDMPGGGTRRILMRITDLDPNRMGSEGVEEQVAIGDKVEGVTRRSWGEEERGAIPYIYAARHPIARGDR